MDRKSVMFLEWEGEHIKCSICEVDASGFIRGINKESVSTIGGTMDNQVGRIKRLIKEFGVENIYCVNDGLGEILTNHLKNVIKVTVE